jgi:hypothetical protein
MTECAETKKLLQVPSLRVPCQMAIVRGPGSAVRGVLPPLVGPPCSPEICESGVVLERVPIRHAESFKITLSFYRPAEVETLRSPVVETTPQL